MSSALSVAFLLLAAIPAAPQTTLLDAGYRQMYDLDFGPAHRSFQQWMQQHPEDAMGPASDAAAWLFAEFDRLHILQSEIFAHDDTFLNRAKPSPDPKVKPLFEGALARSEKVAADALSRDPNDENALLASAIRQGLRADYLGLIEKRYMASISEMKAGRLIAEKLIARNPNLGDAYLAVGVENYTLSQKAAPVRWFLRLGGAQTDYERGVRDVSLAAEHGHYLAPFAKVLLAVAALRDKNPERAKDLLRELALDFPHNPLYPRELARIH